MIPNLLTIAGSDPSGGAGIQADLKTFAALGAYGMAAMTALTAQNTRGVRGVHMVPPDFLKSQLEAVFEDISVDAVKIGMAGTTESIGVIADVLERFKPPVIVLDPVMIAQSGDRLLGDDALSALQTRLIPLATVLTPNIPEAQVLAGMDADDPETLVRALSHLGPDVLVKGGHAQGKMAEDVLWHEGRVHHFSAPRLDTKNNHGTGCTLSSAIAVFLARELELPEAVQAAKAYLTGALEASGELSVGQGAGPVHHGWKKGTP